MELVVRCSRCPALCAQAVVDRASLLACALAQRLCPPALAEAGESSGGTPSPCSAAVAHRLFPLSCSSILITYANRTGQHEQDTTDRNASTVQYCSPTVHLHKQCTTGVRA